MPFRFVIRVQALVLADQTKPKQILNLKKAISADFLKKVTALKIDQTFDREKVWRF
jgi:hypothetical protein